MNKLNLKHLHYFWLVAKEGSIARASEQLHLTPQTISGQIRKLETQTGSELFQKSGRGLVLTDVGRDVFDYADEMFNLVDDLNSYLAGGRKNKQMVLNVGIAMVVPKLLAYRIVSPVATMAEPVRLVCHEAPFADLLANLALNKLDLVIADSPVSGDFRIKAFNHLLGESGVSFFARGRNAPRYRRNFPQSLDAAPVLMPTRSSALRGALEVWFEHHQIIPEVVAEFEDRALMKAFGEAGTGIFTAPTAVEEDVLSKYGVQVVGRSDRLREKFYAITTERKIRHPAVATITSAARTNLFT